MLSKKKIEATMKQLRIDKENLMRERDALVMSRNDVVETNLKLKKANELLEVEKNARTTDKAKFAQTEAKMKTFFEEEVFGLRRTIEDLTKNLEILEARKYDNEHMSTVVEDLRFRVKSLVSENSKLKMETNLVRSKLDASNAMITELSTN